MIERYVIDTCCLIQYFPDIFGIQPTFSSQTRNVLDAAFSRSPAVLLSIPSVAFIEICDKWCRDEEFARKVQFELLVPILNSENIEVRSIDQEVMQNLLKLGGSMTGHDMHDKLVLASAMVLECPLITIDPHIIDYVAETNVIPRTFH